MSVGRPNWSLLFSSPWTVSLNIDYLGRTSIEAGGWAATSVAALWPVSHLGCEAELRTPGQASVGLGLRPGSQQCHLRMKPGSQAETMGPGQVSGSPLWYRPTCLVEEISKIWRRIASTIVGLTIPEWMTIHPSWTCSASLTSCDGSISLGLFSPHSL